jgi:hypothetical protein
VCSLIIGEDGQEQIDASNECKPMTIEKEKCPGDNDAPQQRFISQ